MQPLRLSRKSQKVNKTQRANCLNEQLALFKIFCVHKFVTVWKHFYRLSNVESFQNFNLQAKGMSL